MTINLLTLSDDLLSAAEDVADEAGGAGFVDELFKLSNEIKRPNREKICRFVMNLINNGGRLAEAAIDAGYGCNDKPDGTKRTYDEKRGIAATEAHRLMKDAKIYALYDKMKRQRFTAEIFSNMLDKSHLMLWYYDMFHRYKDNEKKSNVAISAFQELSKLAGYDKVDDKSDDLKTLIEKLDEVSSASSVFSRMPFNKKSKEKEDKERLN